MAELVQGRELAHEVLFGSREGHRIRLLTWADGRALVILGEPEDRAVILSESRMAALDELIEHLKNLATKGEIKIIGLAGPSPRMFCAGADLGAIEGVVDPSEGKRLARNGQLIFSKLEALPVPTVSFISGACVGGGCELVLATTYRIATALPETKIGLPEIRLGILPGFGGTQRLPRLIGFRPALGIILKGAVRDAKFAHKVGLVDELLAVDGEEARAKGGLSAESLHASIDRRLGELLLSGIPSRKSLPLVEQLLNKVSFVRKFAAGEARKKVLRETKGRLPAPVKALEMADLGLSLSTSVGAPLAERHAQEKGYEREAEELGKLIVTPESKALVHVYRATELSGKWAKGSKDDRPFKTVGVVGAGTMGAGIAATALLKGMKVVAVEPIAAVRSRAKEQIVESLKKRGKESAVIDLSLSTELSDLRVCDIVIEAIVEVLPQKQELFKTLEGIVPEETLLATNTSSLPLTEIGAEMKDPKRLVGIHFFNPAEQMPLIEVVESAQTPQEIRTRAAAFASALGKFPIVVKETPGFLVNRILAPYMQEALILLEEGNDPFVVDKMLEGFGMPMGPFRLIDEVGVDIALSVAELLAKPFGVRMAPPEFSRRLLAAGRKGKKTGRGFYRHEGKKPTPDSSVNKILGIARTISRKEEVVERCILRLVQEAFFALEEGVAGTTHSEASLQIDLGSVMGFGFPPFMGGVLFYCKKRGYGDVLRALEQHERRFGPRFQPSELLREIVRSNGDVYVSTAGES